MSGARSFCRPDARCTVVSPPRPSASELSLSDNEEQKMQVKDRLPDKARIRQLNDAFRTTFVGGLVVMTAGVDALPSEVKARVLQAVRDFRDFDEGNDPH